MCRTLPSPQPSSAAACGTVTPAATRSACSCSPDVYGSRGNWRSSRNYLLPKSPSRGVAMSGEQLRIGSWVLVRDDCQMYRMVNGRDEVEFAFGSGSAVFDFVFTAKALRRFVWGGLE